MTDLESELRLLVSRHGIVAVARQLREIRGIGRRHSGQPSAQAFVSNLAVDSERKNRLLELALRFDAKQVLPRIADIRNFLEALGVDVSKIRTRPSSIPIVFSYFSSLTESRLQQVMTDGSLSGPSELGPIADAIKSSGGNR